MSTAADLRRLALALPETYEDLHRGKPTFRVAARIFAMLGESGGQGFMGLDRAGVAVVKLDRDDQLNMAAAHPEALEPVPDHGRHGWTMAQLAALDEAALALLVRLAWICVAPKRLTRKS